MNIISIEVRKDTIAFWLSEKCAETKIIVTEYLPATGEDGTRPVSTLEAVGNDNCFEIPRWDGERDRLTGRFTAALGQIPLEGVCYVTDWAAGVSRDESDYPSSPSIMAFGCGTKDEKAFHTSQGGVGFCISAMMASGPDQCETISHVYNGKTYYFRKDVIDRYDRGMQNGYAKGFRMTCAIINSTFGYGVADDPALLQIITHPHQDHDFKEAYMCSFNVTDEPGTDYFCACIDFLAQRYTRPDRKYGLMCGMILSNEINSQYYWGNAGEMTCAEYMREYTTVMRLTWQICSKYFRNYRVYVTMDHFWNTSIDPGQPLRFYSGRETIEQIAKYSHEDGDFNWNVVFHPYPEDLRCPDFWNDRTAEFNFSTKRITFKNVEMMPAYLSQPHLLYRGQPRRIVLNEQGFNSLDGPLAAYSEEQAAAAYVLAYMKIRKQPTIDYFTVHAYVDNPWEFGLNLGVYRYDPASPDKTGERKPIYDAICDMDTEREPERIERARAFIGAPLFDYLLDPPIRYADRDTSRDGLSKEGT